MATMSESFVDLSYRGLALGKRIRLTQVRPDSGYLEIPTPMPVGTAIGVATDEGLVLDATVAEVHEQVGGSDRVPGMLVRPNLETAAAEKWWKARTDLPATKPDRPAPAADAGGVVTVMSPRMTGQTAVPEVMDDGRNTAVMDAIDPDTSGPIDTLVADLPLHDPAPAPLRDAAVPASRDEASSTMMMDAVDLAALGLTSQSGQMAAVKPEDYADEAPNPDATGPAGAKAKKKRKRRS
jgi:hypothetical protein